jgi:hypothetical protein
MARAIGWIKVLSAFDFNLNCVTSGASREFAKNNDSTCQPALCIIEAAKTRIPEAPGMMPGSAHIAPTQYGPPALAGFVHGYGVDVPARAVPCIHDPRA